MKRLLSACVVFLSACQLGAPELSEPDSGEVGLPDGAYSRLDEPLPNGTTLVDADTFAQLSAQPGSRPASAAQRAMDDAAAAAAATADRQTVDEFLAAHAGDPAFAEWAAMLKEPVDPALPKDADGHLLTFTGNNGASTVHTLGVQAKVAAAANAIRLSTSRDNRLALYRALTDGLSIELRDRLNIVPSTVVETLTDSDLAKQLDHVTSVSDQLVAALRVQFPAVTPLRACTTDFGRGALKDHYGYNSTAAVDACAHPRATGIVANYDWALKPSLSCVKDQGSRGTCWSFMSTAMMETAEAVKYGDLINYSEQDLVNRVKLQWWPSYFGDNAGVVLPRMVQERYRPVFENAWSYNPSPWRHEDDVRLTYTNSCNNYLEDCSDTNHQGRLVCHQQQVNVCIFVGHDNPNGTNAPTSVANVFNPGNFPLTVAQTVIALAQKKSVGLGFDVHPAFDAAGADGWVRLDPKNPGTNRGGHFVQIAGYISNSDLSTLLPSAPQGLGGGYFIIKNSWGACAGDAGYYYVPVDYVRMFGWSIEILNGIE